ncbi:MAG: protein phosphatase 2C domain-containing protein [Desulfohalobiaceae bacterium]
MLYAAQTHTGLVRSENQDAVQANPETGLFVLADGMGGHSFGSEASRIAVKEINDNISAHSPIPEPHLITDDYLMQTMRHSFARAHRAILEFASSHKVFEPMGTTATALWVVGERGVVGHIGDSRLYRKQNQDLSLLTSPQTVAQELVDMGRLSPRDAAASRYANVLSRVLGVQNKFDPEIQIISLQPGDAFLLCSDGLSNLVSSKHLSEIMGTDQTLEDKASAMIDAALEQGAPDNVSLILVAYGL